MARIIRHDAHEPYVVAATERDGKDLYLCACGLSKNKPFCDASHKATLDEAEGALYRYEGDIREGERSVVSE